MNSSVPSPQLRRFPASSKALRKSAMPENTADSATKWRLVRVAMIRASVVLPQPGGPHRIKLASRPESIIRRSGASGPSR